MFHLFEDKVANFVKSHSKAVIATVDELEQPYTTIIFYIADKHDDILFITKSQTKKFQNLSKNNKAALTIVNDHKPITVNITGIVSEITDQVKRDEIMQQIFKLSYSELNDYAPIIKLHKGSFSVLKLTPVKAKMTDFNKPMDEVKEDLKNY